MKKIVVIMVALLSAQAAHAQVSNPPPTVFLNSSQTFSQPQTVTPPQAANTYVNGLILADPTAASTGNQQYSPSLLLTGQGWKTTATAASQEVDWRITNVSAQGTTAPGTDLLFAYQIAGGGYTTLLDVSGTYGGIYDFGFMFLTGGLYLGGVTSDTGITDNSVCVNTTSHLVYYGSGTLGICLGTSSFRAAKESVEPITGALGHLAQLQPINYFYKPGFGDGGAREQYGFIADDYAKVFPDLSRFDEFGNPTGIDMYGLVPVLVASDQEMQVEISSIMKRLSKLEHMTH